MNHQENERRSFLQRLLTFGGAAAVAPAAAQAQSGSGGASELALPAYARAQNYPRAELPIAEAIQLRQDGR
ncbi:exported hypothetical protein [Candidatus Sulfopaludibacter sp. SbA3]|nr:exported hypothetical protein [Candidatus Sulfopaludibacter sp. SbA3]